MADEQQQQEQGQEQQSQLEATEKEAKLLGWVPKEEFNGDESRWVDAETFVRRGKEINPILKKNNERLMNELAKRDREIAEMQLTMKEFSEMYQKMSDTAYERALKDIKGQIKLARREGDDDLVETLEEQRDALVEEARNVKIPGKKDSQATPPANSPEAQRRLENWMGENTWYDVQKNPDLVYLADGYAMRLAKSKPHLVGTQEFLDEVSAEMKRLAPERLENKARKAGSPVGGSSESRSGTKGGKKSYNDLPPEAKQACDRFVKQIPGYTKEKYVSDYFSGE